MTGTTACVCLIDEKENKIYFANCGDSRAVLFKKNTAFPQSIDHKPELPIEKNRIINAKGWISMGRVKGNLNLSRSIGDFAYKEICNFVKKNVINKEKFSEGINEMLDGFLAEEIVNETGIGCDNMTCIVVQLKKSLLN